MDFIKGILKDWKSPIDSYDTYDSNLLLFKASSQRNWEKRDLWGLDTSGTMNLYETHDAMNLIFMS